MYVSEASVIKDTNWVKQAFFKRKLGGAGANSRDLQDGFNFYDTTLGGNRSMNPPPQFCRFADPKVTTIAKSCKSMGHGYKTAIDDNAQRISLQFGLPEYNAMSTFLANFYDRQAADLARFGTGSPGIMYRTGEAVGVLFTLPIQTFFGINYVWSRLSATISGNPYSKFYYMKPTMPLYWNAVALLFNKIMVDMGIMDPVDPDEIKDGKIVLNTQLESLKRILPDIISGTTEDGFHVDVKSLASRSQRLANEFNTKIMEIETSIGETGLTGAPARQAFIDQVTELQRKAAIRPATLVHKGEKEYLDAYFQSPLGSLSDGTTTPTSEETTDHNQPDANSLAEQAKERSVFHRFAEIREFVMADLQEGSAFVTFTVDKTGPVSHSFSNSTKTAPLKEAANSAAQTARNMTVNLFGGNLTDNVVGNTLESVIDGVRRLVAGGLSSVGLSGLDAVASGALMEMSDVFDDSSASLNQTNYSITLGTPYGNKYSILTRVYLPLCMLIAGVLPRRTGKNSYTAPFLCRLHSQGFEDIRLGVISEMGIELGTSNIGRSVDGLPTQIKVSLTVETMDKTMSMPLSDSVLDEVLNFSAFDEDTTLTDFLSSLAGTDLQAQYFAVPRVKRAWRKTVADWEQFSSPAYFSQWFSGTLPGKTLSAFLKSGDI